MYVVICTNGSREWIAGSRLFYSMSAAECAADAQPISACAAVFRLEDRPIFTSRAQISVSREEVAQSMVTRGVRESSVEV